MYTDLKGKLDIQFRTLQQIEEKDVQEFNKLMQELGIPNIYVPPVKPKTVS